MDNQCNREEKRSSAGKKTFDEGVKKKEGREEAERVP